MIAGQLGFLILVAVTAFVFSGLGVGVFLRMFMQQRIHQEPPRIDLSGLGDDAEPRTNGVTDKDLEWWKREHGSPMSQALLARLAAAEKVCEWRWDVACQEGVGPGETHLLKEWLKTKGVSYE